MTTPTKLKVGHRIFTISVIDAQEREEFGYAETDGFEGVIYINKSLRGTKLADAILHEALHAFNHVHGITFGRKKDPEEDAVNSSSGSVTTILSDNPSFRKWWVSLF
jgi:Zn-dependent peptidase ImmA (M78 family)